MFPEVKKKKNTILSFSYIISEMWTKFVRYYIEEYFWVRAVYKCWFLEIEIVLTS